ncbi:hypothetical protein EBB07_29085 [Paenibacillaceae bacterium]|nr:hypothetical protein EBB07_29085 [Paenibacillaceae bacterium]
MDVGKGCTISDKWIPKGLKTGLKDINGIALKTADKVRLNGCTSRYAFVGFSMEYKLMLFFGSEHGSVGWHLDDKTITKHKIRVV